MKQRDDPRGSQARLGRLVAVASIAVAHAVAVVVAGPGDARGQAQSEARVHLGDRWETSEGVSCTVTSSTDRAWMRCRDSERDVTSACTPGPVADVAPAPGAERVWVCPCAVCDDYTVEPASALVLADAAGAVLFAADPALDEAEGEARSFHVAVADLVPDDDAELLVLARDSGMGVVAERTLLLDWQGGTLARAFSSRMSVVGCDTSGDTNECVRETAELRIAAAEGALLTSDAVRWRGRDGSMQRPPRRAARPPRWTRHAWDPARRSFVQGADGADTRPATAPVPPNPFAAAAQTEVRLAGGVACRVSASAGAARAECTTGGAAPVAEPCAPVATVDVAAPDLVGGLATRWVGAEHVFACGTSLGNAAPPLLVVLDHAETTVVATPIDPNGTGGEPREGIVRALGVVTDDPQTELLVSLGVGGGGCDLTRTSFWKWRQGALVEVFVDLSGVCATDADQPLRARDDTREVFVSLQDLSSPGLVVRERASGREQTLRWNPVSFRFEARQPRRGSGSRR